jgi:hypothetical protein
VVKIALTGLLDSCFKLRHWRSKFDMARNNREKYTAVDFAAYCASYSALIAPNLTYHAVSCAKPARPPRINSPLPVLDDEYHYANWVLIAFRKTCACSGLYDLLHIEHTALSCY